MVVNDKKGLKTGYVAELIGVSPQTLRNWQERGVLVPEIICSSGHRLYSEEQVAEFIKKNEVQ